MPWRGEEEFPGSTSDPGGGAPRGEPVRVGRALRAPRLEGKTRPDGQDELEAIQARLKTVTMLDELRRIYLPA